MGEHQFTLHPLKQFDYWRGVVGGVMWAFVHETGEKFSWRWGYENGEQSWTCKVECDYELFARIKDYIGKVIPGYVFK